MGVGVGLVMAVTATDMKLYYFSLQLVVLFCGRDEKLLVFL